MTERATFKTVTPQMAAGFLKKNCNNRRVDKNRVGRYAGDIISGNWIPSNATIMIDENGEMVDGQHKCLAIIRADKPIRCLVIEGVSERAKIHIDEGKSRSFSDFLQIQGYVNSKIVAAITRRLFDYENGRIWGHGNRCMSMPADVSNALLYECFVANPDIESAGSFIQGKAQGKAFQSWVHSSANAGLVYIYAMRKEECACNDFFTFVAENKQSRASGRYLNSLSAPHHFRMKLEKIQSNPTQLAATSMIERLAWCIQAWNSFLSNEQRHKTLPWWKRGQEFPKFAE